MSQTEKTPAASTDRGARVRPLIDQDMADTVARLANLRRILGEVNDVFKIELGLPNRIEDAEETNG